VARWILAFAGNRTESEWGILVLRQAQDEDELESADLPLFLMLSLSKHKVAPLQTVT
jgi:hypothetical protein